MAAQRTQIYLSAEQRAALDRLREVRGESLAEVIRDAVDAYLAQGSLDPDAALDRSFGLVPDAAAPARSEWASREARLGPDRG